MLGLGTTELIVILGIAFLVFGGKKLPEIGAGLGEGIRSFKNSLKEDKYLPPESQTKKEPIEGEPI